MLAPGKTRSARLRILWGVSGDALGSLSVLQGGEIRDGSAQVYKQKACDLLQKLMIATSSMTATEPLM